MADPDLEKAKQELAPLLNAVYPSVGEQNKALELAGQIIENYTEGLIGKN